MKKLLVIGALVFGCNLQMNAQTKFGITGGLSLGTATAKTGTTSYSSSSRTSLSLGVIADFKGANKFNVRSGLIYNGLGGKFDSDYLGADGTLALDYLTIPVLARFKIAEGFHGYAGPQIGILVNSKAKSGGETEDIKDEFKGTAFFGLIGAEYNFNQKVAISVNYNLGLNNITNSSESGSKFTTSGFSLNVGYSF